MSEYINNREMRKNTIKEIIRQLHEGKTVEEVKALFEASFEGVSASEISEAEGALIAEGLLNLRNMSIFLLQNVPNNFSIGRLFQDQHINGQRPIFSLIERTCIWAANLSHRLFSKSKAHIGLK